MHRIIDFMLGETMVVVILIKGGMVEADGDIWKQIPDLDGEGELVEARGELVLYV